MGYYRTTSTISSRTWTERQDDAGAPKIDIEHPTWPHRPLQADSSYPSLGAYRLQFDLSAGNTSIAGRRMLHVGDSAIAGNVP